MTDLALRLAAITQLAVLLGCGFGWHLAHREHIPKSAWMVGWGYGYVIALVAVAITLNAVASEDVTPGLKVLTVALIPATVWVLSITVHSARVATSQARAVLAWVDSLDHLEPCPNPDCITKRAEVRELVKERAK